MYALGWQREGAETRTTRGGGREDARKRTSGCVFAQLGASRLGAEGGRAVGSLCPCAEKGAEHSSHFRSIQRSGWVGKFQQTIKCSVN